MNQSESIKELATALAKAQGQMEGAKRDNEALVQLKDNKGSFKYKYSDMAAVWEACRKPLTDNGLSIIQKPEGGPDTVTVKTMLLHSSGEWIENSLTMRSTKPDAQGLGSAITYACRYSLMAMVGIPPEDDDAQQACKQTERPTQQPKQQQPLRAVQKQVEKQPEPVHPLNARMDEARRIAGEIMQMVDNGELTAAEVNKFGEIASVNNAKNSGDVEALGMALEKIKIRLKEIRESEAVQA